MSGKSVNFNDIKIKKSDFHKNKKINNIEDINTDNILVFKKEPYGTKKNSFKYFIGYNDNDIIRPLCIRLCRIGQDMLGNLMKMQHCLL